MPKIPEKYEDWTPPWGEGEFDEDKAKRLVYNALLGQQKAKDTSVELRTENDTLKTSLAAAEAKVGDKGKADSEKDTELAALRAENRKLTTEGRDEDKSLIQRLDIALDHGLTKRDARRLVGNTPEELEDDAKDFAERLGISKNDDDDGDKGGSRPPSRQPVPASQLGNGRDRGNGQNPELLTAADLVKQGRQEREPLPFLTR